MRTVAVIDIGSNTIKLLVARKTTSGKIESLVFRTLEARMGKGISAANPIFPPEVIERGTAAVADLVAEARAHHPERIAVVATSAVRDAHNRDAFAETVRDRTGLQLEILSGEREAQLIGQAVQLDPAISAEDYYVFDLGGGSLECLRFRSRELEQEVSLPLGAVRLTEKFVADPSAPFSADAGQAVADEVKRVLRKSGFAFSLPGRAPAVGTGGTLTSSLDILASEQGRSLKEMPRFLSQNDLRHLLDRIGRSPLSERLKIERLSPGRADVFPVALAIFLALLDLTGRPGLHHSLLNLRYGLAVELLRDAGEP